VNNVAPFARAFDARQQSLMDQEAADLAALLKERPVQIGDNNVVAWSLVRAPERFELTEEAAGAVVVVLAEAKGLSLTVTRQLWRRKDGAPLAGDREAVAALLRAQELECVGPLPLSRSAPAMGLRLRLELEASDERERVVTSAEGKQ
jgi:hypothetical protein